jgi:hypothetical protein
MPISNVMRGNGQSNDAMTGNECHDMIDALEIYPKFKNTHNCGILP